jgi:hypothetical protein
MLHGASARRAKLPICQFIYLDFPGLRAFMLSFSLSVYRLRGCRIVVLALLPMLSAVGCGGSQSTSEAKAFVPAQSTGAVDLEFQLGGTQLPHRVIRREVVGGRYDFDRYTHDIEFAPMARAEFDSLKATYAGFSLVKSSTPYEPGQAYSLVDFLPPIMQSMLGLKFQEETTSIPLPRRETALASTVANCWGTVYEVLREAQLPIGAFSVFYAHDDVMQEFLRDQSYSSVVKPYSKSLAAYENLSIRNRGLKPGDVLIVGGEWLYHVAIFLDNDLFFEKSGSGSNTLFRLVTYDLLARTWSPEIYGWSYRRFDGEPLPDAMSLFGVRAVFADDPKLRELPDSLAADLSVVRSEINGSQRDSYFLRKRYPVAL